MKISRLYILIVGIVFFISCQKNESNDISELNIENEQELDSKLVSGKYGAEVVQNDILSPAEMVSEVEKNGYFEGKISGTIKEVCTKKGCWLTMDLPSGETMRVTFKDYGFFVPTTSQGYPIILEGKAIMTETDVETLRHYAKDGGQNKEEIAKITSPKGEITFEAVGAIIKEKA
jgi:hypothetical protein